MHQILDTKQHFTSVKEWERQSITRILGFSNSYNFLLHFKGFPSRHLVFTSSISLHSQAHKNSGWPHNMFLLSFLSIWNISIAKIVNPFLYCALAVPQQEKWRKVVWVSREKVTPVLQLDMRAVARCVGSGQGVWNLTHSSSIRAKEQEKTLLEIWELDSTAVVQKNKCAVKERKKVH